MRNKIIAVMAVKAVIILTLLVFGVDGLNVGDVFAETSNGTHAKPAAADKAAGPAEKSLLAAINARQRELDQKDEELKTREERLKVITADIDARIAELNKVHGKIEAFVKKIDEINDVRVKKLVKIYESMNPEEAASRMEKLDEDMAVMILASVAEKKAAKILGFVNIDKSVRLSRSLKVKN
ncbi:MAG: hypothetical protein HYV24_08665 [Deltaproteobacteria bacterium]|nr:hypothetical protein [Deltaproteobacteria bacterium]